MGCHLSMFFPDGDFHRCIAMPDFCSTCNNTVCLAYEAMGLTIANLALHLSLETADFIQTLHRLLT